jgi:hypothetical protein
MAAAFTPLKNDASLQKLLEEAKEHEIMIGKIKLQVAEDSDNLKHPVPLFQQLQTA